MIVSGIMPAWMPFAHWKWWLFTIALLAFLALVGQMIFQRLEDKKRDLDQTQRDEVLAKMAKLLEGQDYRTVSNELGTARNQPQSADRARKHDRDNALLEMSADDPLIYLAIEPATEAMFARTPFVLSNEGKRPAHNVTIQPFKLCRKQVAFATIGAIPVREKASVLPNIADSGAMIQHDIFYWLTKDWDTNGEIVGEWPVPIRITYDDPLNQKHFETTLTLVFFPITHMMNKRHKPPSFIKPEPNWEIRNIEHRALNGH